MGVTKVKSTVEKINSESEKAPFKKALALVVCVTVFPEDLFFFFKSCLSLVTDAAVCPGVTLNLS